MGAHGDVLGGLGGDFLGQDEVEKVGEGEVLGGSFLKQRLEPFAALEQPQALKVFLQALELGGVHAAPPSSAS